jgi:hypothetical protein
MNTCFWRPGENYWRPHDKDDRANSSGHHKMGPNAVSQSFRLKLIQFVGNPFPQINTEEAIIARREHGF